MGDLKSVVRELKLEQQNLERRVGKLKRAIKILKGSGAKAPPSHGRNISAAGRSRIAAAQRKRWAKIRAAKKH